MYVFSRKKPKSNAWVAPEHARATLGMRRDYPRDDWGYPIRESKKELVIDTKPQILQEQKKKYEPNKAKRPKLEVAPAPKNHKRASPTGFGGGRWSFDPGETE